jgi:hypothetical protein
MAYTFGVLRLLCGHPGEPQEQVERADRQRGDRGGVQGGGEATVMRVGNGVEGAGCGGGAEPAMPDLHDRPLVAVLGEDRPVWVSCGGMNPHRSEVVPPPKSPRAQAAHAPIRHNLDHVRDAADLQVAGPRALFPEQPGFRSLAIGVLAGVALLSPEPAVGELVDPAGGVTLEDAYDVAFPFGFRGCGPPDG